MSGLLIVDDDQDFCDLISDYLSAYFEHIESVCSVPDAIGKVKSGQYDLIVLDLNLGSGSGFSVLKYARRDDCLNFKTPVLVVSGEVEADISSYTFTDFLGKPFKEEELLAKVRKTTVPRESKKNEENREAPRPATHPELLKLLKKG